MARVNFSAHGKAIEDARRRVMNSDADAQWALFSTDKDGNLKVQEIGDGSLDDLEEQFDSGKIQYALARVQDPNSKLNKFVFISWCGDGVPTAMKGRFNSHVADMSNFLKGHHIHINARNEDDVKASYIMAKVRDSSGAKYSVHNEVARKEEPIEPVGSVYEPQVIPDMNALSLHSAQKQEDVPIRSVYEPAKLPEPRRLSKDRITPRGSQEELETSIFVKRPSVSSIRGIPITVPGFGASESSVDTPAQRRAQQEREEREREEQAHREREERHAQATKEERLQRKSDEQEKDRTEQAVLQRQRQAVQQQQRQEQQRQREEEERQRNKKEEEERARAATAKESSIIGSAVHSIADTASAAGSAISHAIADTASAATNFISHVVHPASTTAVVLYPYEAAESNEMSLVEGETITNIEQIDEGWWHGIGQDGVKSGLFPSNYVQINANEQSPSNTMNLEPTEVVPDETLQTSDEQAAPGAVGLTATALYDYTAGEENEISFGEGDTIINVEMVSDDWWQGEVAGKNGIGLFPANYVKINGQ